MSSTRTYQPQYTTPQGLARLDAQRDHAKAEWQADKGNLDKAQRYLDLMHRALATSVRPDARARPDNAY